MLLCWGREPGQGQSGHPAPSLPWLLTCTQYQQPWPGAEGGGGGTASSAPAARTRWSWEGGDTPSPPPCYRESGPSQARTPQTSLPRARSSTAVPRCCPIPPLAPRLRPSSASSPTAAAGTAACTPMAGSAPRPLPPAAAGRAPGPS